MFDRDDSSDLEEVGGTYRVGVADHESPSEALVRGAMELTDGGLSDIDPLYECIDPEALDEVFEDAATPRRGSVFFEYSGYDVVVEDGDRVTFRPAERTLGFENGSDDGDRFPND